MIKTLCIVSAQIYNENGKPKGEQQFTLEVEADVFMFAPTKLIEDALQSIIQENYPYAGKVEYRSYELQFSEPIKCDNELGKRMQELYDKKGEFQYT